MLEVLAEAREDTVRAVPPPQVEVHHARAHAGHLPSNGTGALLEIDSYTLTPDDIKASEKLRIQASAKLLEAVDGGKIEVTAKLDGMSVYANTYDLCDEAKKSGFSTCPIPAVAIPVDHAVDIPSLPIKSGTVSLHVEITRTDGKQVACVDAKFSLK